jgi:Holliday junction DNA helicase RuvA
MIINIKGILKKKLPEEAVIETGGLSYLCFISNNTYDRLPSIGSEVSLNTYFHVNDNSQQLFGFENITEKELFMMLISVSGIGPKTAIILLSAISPEEFKRRLIAGEVAMLTALPGIGPKTARRIIVELKDKFVSISKDELPKEELDIIPELNDAYSALEALGFHINDIRRVISKIYKKGDQIKLQELIKKALVELS